jgi:HEPN domain-containing protein
MPHDPVLIAETAEWFRRAAEDLAAGAHDLGAKPALTRDAAFHAQQAAEKAMKGFLMWHGRPFRKTHNLVELGEQCLQMDSTLEVILRKAAPLTEYAWKFRYPGEAEAPSARICRDALATAHAVYDRLLAGVPPEVLG